MKPYEYLEHTADLKFKAYGKSLEELFKNSALAMFNTITDTEKIKKTTNFNINVTGKDPEELLFEFLNELIFLLDAEFFLLSGFEEIIIKKNNKEYKLNSTALGDINEGQYETYGNIKAVTFNDLKIYRQNDVYVAEVVVDQ